MKDQCMNTVKISTKYSKTIRVKNKTLVIFLRTPQTVELYGGGIPTKYPLQMNIKNDKDEILYEFTEEVIWDSIKQHKKSLKTTKRK